eukprot:NODE_25304_length_592_cov_1.610753.p4 GENE.NODE_25304_length_592_cov_1.610753~~NODE_25304_length_592_cov_1.610753.p4  ORF type:complete len:60 (-),score=19.26 NODE_25304_length_592_cov_1.610753:68-247(-)
MFYRALGPATAEHGSYQALGAKEKEKFKKKWAQTTSAHVREQQAFHSSCSHIDEKLGVT